MLESDKPITSACEDKLNMSKPANSLARILSDEKDSDSLVVGIYGEWGSGKSSFINLLKQDLIELSNSHPEYKQPVMITFDPWLCTSDNAMLHRFFEELATFLDKETNLKDIAKNIIKYAKIVAPLIPLPGLPYSVECASAALEDSEITTEDLKNKIEESLKTYQKKFYIFIDDLDRLPDNQIRLIFQLVNHLADFSNITYVIAFDHDVVTTALNKIQSGKGTEYLQKIIQLPYSIPRPVQELVIEILLEKLSVYIEKVPDKNFSHYRFFNIQNSFIRTYIHTLRDVKLLINTFSINIIKLSDELDLIDLLALSLLKAFNQSLYKWIYENKNTLCKYESNQQRDGYIENLSKSLLTSGVCTEQNLQNTIALLSELFPKVAYKGAGSSSTEDRRLRRISCDDNFNQYFSGDFPLTYVLRDDLNKILNANDSSITQEIINEAIANGRLTNLLNEIKYNLDFSNTESLKILSEQLIYTLGKSSEYINKSFFGMPADTLMSFILSNVLKKIGKDDSDLIIKKSLNYVDLDNILSFAYWLNHEELVHGRLASNEKSEDKQSINIATLVEIEQIYAKKLEGMISNTDLLSIHFDLHLPMYLWSCYNFERYKDFWIKKFNDDDLNYIVFIDSISNELTSSSYKKWSWDPADFNKLISYEKIKSHILKLKKSEKLKNISTELICKAITFVEMEPNEESNLNDQMDSEFTSVQAEKKLSEWII